MPPNAPAQQTLASAVIATLSEVGAADGPGVAYPARRALAKTADALDEDIKFANANSEFLS